MYFDTGKNAAEVFVCFLEDFARVYLNKCLQLYKTLFTYPGLNEFKLDAIFENSVLFCYRLMIDFCSWGEIEPFEVIYQNFKPEKDYTTHYFEIINKHLEYIESKNANKQP